MEGYTIGGACNRLKGEKGVIDVSGKKRVYEEVMNELTEISELLKS